MQTRPQFEAQRARTATPGPTPGRQALVQVYSTGINEDFMRKTDQQSVAAGSGEHTGVHSFATQCLHNVIFLGNQLLPQAHDQTSSSQIPQEASHSSSDATGKSAEAPLNSSGGLPYPSNGHRGRLGTTREGSAAEAAEQLAMLSLDRTRASSGEQHTSKYTHIYNGIYI